LIIAGCADQAQKPPARPAAAAPVVAVKAASGDAPVPAPADDADAAQRRRDKWAGLNGYKIIKKDGLTKYCKTWQETASRIRTETRCLSAADIEKQELQNLRALSQPAIAPPPH
jgi:hypothetical protein